MMTGSFLLGRQMTIDLHRIKMDKVLRWIEENMDKDLNIEKLSEIACYSKFHFHRLFRAYAGENVIAFRKRLLLERAAHQLVYSQSNITEIAFNAGYDNQSSFNKAFRKKFDNSPSEFRNKKLIVNNDPLPELNVEIAMKPEIKEIPTLHLICVRKQGSYKDASADAWGALMGFAYSNKIMKKETKLIGISYDNPEVTNPEQIRYDACITVDSDVKLDSEVKKIEIKKGRYAVFLHKGSYDKFSQTYAEIFNHWLPESGYELRDKPCFEIYLNRDPRRTKPENLKTEIYVPIR